MKFMDELMVHIMNNWGSK